MLRSRLKWLEEKIEAIQVAEDTWPRRIVLRVIGCRHPEPETYSLAENGRVVVVAGCKGGDCRQCPHYEFRRDKPSE